MLPQNYKEQIFECVDELWSVWRSFGVYSDGAVSSMALEEAIIGLCIWGRYDQRLFDEAFSFIMQHSRFISKNRLLYLFNKVDSDSKKVYHVIAAGLKQMNNDSRFFTELTDKETVKEQPFFISLHNAVLFTGRREDALFSQFGFKRNIFTKSNKLRNLSFVAENNQWIKAKLVFGNTVKADTVMELVCNKNCTAPAIAYNTGYTQKSVWNVLTDYESAGLVTAKKSFNRILYSLSNNGEKLFMPFKIQTKLTKLSTWLKTGHFLAALNILPDDASDELLRSEEIRTEKLISNLNLDKKEY